MCWNQEVSLNTFLFSGFVLLLVIYNNEFTKYKVKSLDNVWKYAFLASFIIMQLVEFFLWRNLDNRKYNHMFSALGAFVLFIQPLCSLMILSDSNLRNTMMALYVCLAVPYMMYTFSQKQILSVESRSGHLRWLFAEMDDRIFAIWLFFFLFSLFYNVKKPGNWSGGIFGIVLLCISLYNYSHEHTVGSMWCWMVNLIMVYYAVYLLIYLPFFETG
jgi:hypothetical protein